MYDSAKIKELILRRRRQILVHSVIYYRYNENLISDHTWTKWAVELEALQKKYPKEAESTPWNREFKDFDHSTGYNLPLEDPWANCIARWLLEISTDYRGDVPKWMQN